MHVGLARDATKALNQASKRVAAEIEQIARRHALRYRGPDGTYLVFQRPGTEALGRDDARALAASVFRDVRDLGTRAAAALITLADGIRIT